MRNVRFNIFKEVFEKFNSLSPEQFTTFVLNVWSDCRDNLWKSKYNIYDTGDFLFECGAFEAFMMYMSNYGKKHLKDIDSYKTEQDKAIAIIDCSSISMYSINKIKDLKKWETTINELLQISLNSQRMNKEPEESFEDVIKHCQSHDLNPFYLLYFFKCYLEALEMQSNN